MILNQLLAVALLFPSCLLLYLAVMSAARGLSAKQGRLMLAAIFLVSGGGIFLCHNVLGEGDRFYHEVTLTLMRFTEYAILSDHTKEAASILHKQSDQLAKAPYGDWDNALHEAIHEMAELDTNNDAVKSARKEAVDAPWY